MRRLVVTGGALALCQDRISIGDGKPKNPMPLSSGMIADGKKTFGHYCADCHGKDVLNTV